MPELLDACVAKVMGKGHDEKSAYAICKSSMDMAKNKEDEKEITDCALKMCDDMKSKDMAEMEYGELKGIDIFAAGNWNGDDYSVDDLDKIVASFQETKEKLRPYLKLGHGNDQKLLKEDELPAAGFVQSIYRQGRKILADVTHVPKKIFELIKRKAYNKVSVELYKDIPIEGKKYDWALKAIALLGGATPAVHDLDDILALYSNKNEILAFNTKAELKKVSIELQNFSEEADMELKELQEKHDLLQEEVKKFTEEIVALKKEKEDLTAELQKVKEFADKSSAEVEKLMKEKKTSAIDAKVKEFIEAKKIIPAQAEKLKVILQELPVEKKFSIGDKEFGSLEEVILSFLSEGQAVGLPTDENSEVGKKHDENDQDLKIKEYMAKHSVSYKDAFVAVASEPK